MSAVNDTRVYLLFVEVRAASLSARQVEALLVGGQRRFADARPPLALLAGPLSLLTALLVFRRLELARFLFQHDRNAVANRISEPRRLGDELLPLAIVDQRSLGDGANQNLKQLGVHGSSFPPAQPEQDRCAP